MTSTDEYGPDNPRPWDPNHRLLKSAYAPHETAAVLRIQRTGLRGTALVKATHTKAVALMKSLERALDAENVAKAQGRGTHDATVPKGTA